MVHSAGGAGTGRVGGPYYQLLVHTVPSRYGRIGRLIYNRVCKGLEVQSINQSIPIFVTVVFILSSPKTSILVLSVLSKL